MSTVSVLNTDAQLNAKTLALIGSANSGHLLFTDATYDIGQSGATRPRDGFFSRNLVVGGTFALTGHPTIEGVTATGATGTGLMVFSAAPTLSGTVTVSGGQIAFPAAQSASADANTLDDYEEGAWTPVLGGGGGTSGQTYTTQVGTYVKVGQLVLASYQIVLSAKGTITGSAQIQGLPFTSSAANLNQIALVLFSGLATNWIAINTTLTPGATAASLNGNTAAATGNNTALVTGDITNTTLMNGTIMYRAGA